MIKRRDPSVIETVGGGGRTAFLTEKASKSISAELDIVSFMRMKRNNRGEGLLGRSS
jgi:hypothetical protein